MSAGRPASPITAGGTNTKILTWLDDHSRYALRITADRRVDADLFVGFEKLGHRRQRGLFFRASGGNANRPVTHGWLRASKAR